MIGCVPAKMEEGDDGSCKPSKGHESQHQHQEQYDGPQQQEQEGEQPPPPYYFNKAELQLVRICIDAMHFAGFALGSQGVATAILGALSLTQAPQRQQPAQSHGCTA